MRNLHKPLFLLKPLDTNPPLGRCYIVTTLLCSRSGWSHAMLSTHTPTGSTSSRSLGITQSFPLLRKPYPTKRRNRACAIIVLWYNRTREDALIFASPPPIVLPALIMYSSLVWDAKTRKAKNPLSLYFPGFCLPIKKVAIAGGVNRSVILQECT